MYALSKINKQSEQTWINLQKRLNQINFTYSKLFTRPEIYDFVRNKAVLVGSCKGYFVPSLLTTTAYALACSKSCVQTLTHSQPLNLFTIFVGFSGTGNHYFWLNLWFCVLMLFILYLRMPIILCALGGCSCKQNGIASSSKQGESKTSENLQRSCTSVKTKVKRNLQCHVNWSREVFGEESSY